MLGQLGSRVQHALRAFTPEDADALRKVVRTYPKSDFYDLETLLTSLGTGEAAVVVLSEKGVPTPVVHTRLRGPQSSMTPSPDLEAAANASPLAAKYGERLDRDSAAEVLAARVEAAPEPEVKEPVLKPKTRTKAPKAPGDPLTDFLGSRAGRQIQKEVIRGVFGMLRKRL